MTTTDPTKQCPACGHGHAIETNGATDLTYQCLARVKPEDSTLDARDVEAGDDGLIECGCTWEVETHAITLHWVEEGTTKERRSRFSVRLADCQPLTDAYDAAAEALYAKHPTAEIVDES